MRPLVIGGFWTSFISEFGISGFVNTLGATLVEDTPEEPTTRKRWTDGWAY